MTLQRISAGACAPLVESLERRRLFSGAPVLRPDHVVVVVEEDRASNAIGDAEMPYFNQLAQSGLVYTNSHGVDHPSLPDYLALYSGSTQGINDNFTGYSFDSDNLAKSLYAAGKSFVGYSESLPADGSQVQMSADPSVDPDNHPDLYIRRFNPMAQFTDVGPGKTNADVNKTFNAFPSDFTTLPTVSFVIPDAFHNTHGSNEAPYTDASSDRDRLRINADAWLQSHLGTYVTWAKTHNSLLIVTQDEEEYTSGHADAVTTIISGDSRLIVPGTNAITMNHYSLLRTIEDMYALTPLGQTATVSGLQTDSQGRLAPPALALSSAVSRLTHNGTVDFDVQLPLSSNSGIESRNVANNWKLVLSFDKSIGTVGNVSVTSGTGTAGTPTISGNTLTVPISGATNAQSLTLTATNVQSPDGDSLASAVVTVRLLRGDINGDGTVNISDINLTKAVSGMPMNVSNFRRDINADGAFNISDINLVKAMSGVSVAGGPTGDTAPTISPVGNQTTPHDAPTGLITFTIADAQTDPIALYVSGTSNNQTLVPDGTSFTFGGIGANRTLVITPAAGLTGSAVITLLVSDGQTNTRITFTLTVA